MNNQPTPRLYLKNLNYNTKESTIREFFEKFGTIVEITFIKPKFPGSTNKGFGFVEFKSAKIATEAMNSLNGIEIDGRKIIIEYSSGLKQKQQNIQMMKVLPQSPMM